MKIGILTFHRSYNFGANLQALAMKNMIAAKGASPIIINFQEEWKIEAYKKTILSEQQKQHENFFNEYYQESAVLRTNEEVRDYCQRELDGVIVGSDAVFRLIPKFDPIRIAKIILRRKLSNLPPASLEAPPYWLPWEKQASHRKIVKASVAASSMGTNFYFLQPSLIAQINGCLSDFDFLSVRDQWTKKMIKFITKGKITAEICPDPVFTLLKNQTIPDSEKPDIDLSKTILLSGNFQSGWVNKLINCAHDAGYRVGGLSQPDKEYFYPNADINIKMPFSPLKWFSILGNAAGYIGTRFHALVSCIVQHVPVINVDNHPRSRMIKTSSKMYDLCERAGIPERYYTLKKINSTDPVILLDNLFSTQNQLKANRYAEKAYEQFDSYIDRVLKSVPKK